VSAIRIALRKPEREVLLDLPVKGNCSGALVLRGQTDKDRLRCMIDVAEANIRNLADTQTALLADCERQHEFDLASPLNALPDRQQVCVVVRAGFCQRSTLVVDARDDRVRAVIALFGNQPPEECRKMTQIVAAGESTLTLGCNEPGNHPGSNEVEICDSLNLCYEAKEPCEAYADGVEGANRVVIGSGP